MKRKIFIIASILLASQVIVLPVSAMNNQTLVSGMNQLALDIEGNRILKSTNNYIAVNANEGQGVVEPIGQSSGDDQNADIPHNAVGNVGVSKSKISDDEVDQVIQDNLENQDKDKEDMYQDNTDDVEVEEDIDTSDYSTGDILNERVTPLANNSAIQIDGMYSEWNGIPHTGITYTSYNNEQVHSGALYCDGDILYAHYKMHDTYRSQMIVSNMTLTINGNRTVSIMIQGKMESNQLDWSIPMYNLPQGVTQNLGVFNLNYPNEYMGSASFTVHDKSHAIGDECEFAIDLNVISKMTNIPVENMREFKLHNPNLGSNSITYAGSSSGAVMGVTLMTTVAGISALYYKKKKRVEK